MKANLDIQKIESILADAVRKAGVSERIFKGQRPNLNDGVMTDFVVVSVASSITDMAAMGTCVSRIEIFAKNLSNGEKNSTKLSLMEGKVNGIFPLTDDNYIFDIYPSVIPLGNDDYGFNVIAMQFNTIIKLNE